jgi:hypothetical protein
LNASLYRIAGPICPFFFISSDNLGQEVKSWFKFVTLESGIGFRGKAGEGCSATGVAPT